MKKIALVIFRFIGWGLVASIGVPAAGITLATLGKIKSWHQFYRLITFDYMSFVDSLEAGGAANDFFIALAGLAIASTIWIVLTYKSPARTPRIIASTVFAFVAFSLVYAANHTRVGQVPDYIRAAPEAQ
ncbi:hypothetical protein DPV79_16215 [Burkholderia reimsis]|uniref:Uncharacterized protein n=1 Tax=Burkholderia reimsis TaxID=2234132 RepID=A0A365QUU9_9BURK|nr:hypothetical protein [Burkholderia reimsis]RBB38922.1 hypothetical protein DPV79_16215 [Burkholderia reimsis]